MRGTERRADREARGGAGTGRRSAAVGERVALGGGGGEGGAGTGRRAAAGGRGGGGGGGGVGGAGGLGGARRGGAGRRAYRRAEACLGCYCRWVHSI
jgi:hypothetical protein